MACKQEAVAVKCIAKSKLMTESISEFLQDIENLSTVDHAHVVQLFGVASSNDSFMLVITAVASSLIISQSVSQSVGAI